MDPTISVVIVTHDRPDRLRRAIRSVREQTVPSREFELVVVYDEGDRATEAVRSSDPGEDVRWFAESAGTLSGGRNVGFRNANGAYVAYLDDDAVADPNWVASIVDAFDRVDPTPSCVGGPVVPEFQTRPPEWFPESHASLGVCDHGGTGRWLTFPEEYVIGANVAFGTDLLEEVGGFPTDLGRRAGSLLSDEEILVQTYAAERDGIFYHPNAVVTHFVDSDRLGMWYQLRRFFWQGISTRRTEQLRSSRRIGSSPAGRETERTLGGSVSKAYDDVLANVLSADRRSTAVGLMNLANAVGYVLEHGRLTVWGGTR